MSRIPHSLRIPLAIIGILVLATVIYNIPFVNEKLSWRVDELNSQVIYFFRPPAEAVFIPEQQSQIDKIVTATLLAMRTPTLTPSPEATSTPAGPTATPTITPTPLPASITLPGVVYVDQMGGYNLCGPSNLTMALKFWKWKGQRDEILKTIKPGINDASLVFWKRGQTDKNVMPYEMVDFVNDKTELRALSRYGGNLELIKRFVAAGFPMLIEKGEYQRDTAGVVSWMGHYQFITGYNETAKYFLVQDTYLDGPNFQVPYEKLSNEWRAFNYIFMVVYPADREQQVHDLLGTWADAKWANQHALDIANQETKNQTGLDAYFAWFNKGTSHVQLLQYFDAASAYDQAFLLYSTLTIDKAKFPYRMMWYQTGPYWAYYYAGRYQDVISLANVTLETVSKPTLEESLYWRGLAEQANGNVGAAVADLKLANHLNPGMAAIIQALQTLGASPENQVK
jgi:tetratricopeptide (TPR) repeat protein